MPQNSKKNTQTRQLTINWGIAIALGGALGIALKNTAVGIAVGVALGLALARPKNKNKIEDSQSKNE